MKNIGFLTLFSCLIACQQFESNTTVDSSIKIDSTTNNNVSVSIIDENVSSKEIIEYDSFFTVDDFPITNAELKGKYLSIRSGNTLSHDIAWFINDSIHQSIVIQLATDYFHYEIYYFDAQNISDEIIDRIGLHTKDGEIASFNQKKKDFNGFLKQAARLDTSYFISNNGIKLGDAKNKAIELYGFPNEVKDNNQLKILKWHFSGDMEDNAETKVVAKDSFGHDVTMIFEDNNLIAYILFNDIP